MDGDAARIKELSFSGLDISLTVSTILATSHSDHCCSPLGLTPVLLDSSVLDLLFVRSSGELSERSESGFATNGFSFCSRALERINASDKRSIVRSCVEIESEAYGDQYADTNGNFETNESQCQCQKFLEEENEMSTRLPEITGND